MPYLNIKTSHEIPQNDVDNLIKDASKLCAGTLGKSEDYMMVSLETMRGMVFGGNNEPAAFLELNSIGLPDGSQQQLSASLCKLVSEKLNVSAGRIYINFDDIERRNWGWNGRTFG